MADSAFFVNCVKDTITVNLNNSIDTPKLTFGPEISPGGDVTTDAPFKRVVFQEHAASFKMGPYIGKSIFGSNHEENKPAENQIDINFASLKSGTNRFIISVPDSGRSYYFYIFEDTIVGQNDVGSSRGIKIDIVTSAKKTLQ